VKRYFASISDKIQQQIISRVGDIFISYHSVCSDIRRAEGGAKICWVFCVKNHDFTPKNHIFSNCRRRREKFWGISCEKSRFYAKKSCAPAPGDHSPNFFRQTSLLLRYSTIKKRSDPSWISCNTGNFFCFNSSLSNLYNNVIIY
jgi:hypothetical protein